MNEADEKYQYILNHPGDKAKVVEFFTEEAKNIAGIKKLIDETKDDDDFSLNLSKMIGMANHVRTSKLPLMRKSYGLFQLRQKRIFDSFYNFLLRMQHKYKDEEVK